MIEARSKIVFQRLSFATRALAICLLLAPPLIDAASPAADQRTTQPIDYEEPRVLTATIYEAKSEPRKVLFNFVRTSTRSGSIVRVLREFNSPDGTPTARERIVYDAGKLASYELQDLQSGARGLAVVRPDLKNASQEKLLFEYLAGPGRETKKKFTNSETMDKDVLINDMIPPFILSHWDGLMKGSSEKFRLLVLPRVETVRFKLVKDSETIHQGRAVIRIKMEPASFVTAQLIEPIIFTAEKDGQHRILQYWGRTTPRLKSGNAWKDLDALTVFDWK
jgi:hypothetical protein